MQLLPVWITQSVIIAGSHCLKIIKLWINIIHIFPTTHHKITWKLGFQIKYIVCQVGSGFVCIQLLSLLCQLIGGVSSNSLCFNWPAAGSDMRWTHWGSGSPRLRLRMTMPIMGGGAHRVTSLPPLLSFSELNISNKTPLNKGWLKIERLVLFHLQTLNWKKLKVLVKNPICQKKQNWMDLIDFYTFLIILDILLLNFSSCLECTKGGVTWLSIICPLL